MRRIKIQSETHKIHQGRELNEDVAQTHCHKRLLRIITLGLILRKIVAKKKIEQAEISFGRAKIQDGKGSRAEKTEAAHNLPRDVLLNGCSTYEYADDPECDFHPRIKTIIRLSLTVTVIVKKEANYIDSQWENNGLLPIMSDYLNKCVNIPLNSENEAELLTKIAKKFIEGCKETLNKTPR